MIQIKQQLKYSYKLLELLDKNKNPKALICFIYKYLYELLDEVTKFSPEFLNELLFFYKEYYKKNIFDSKENWLLTLFPVHSEYFNFQNFYIGMIGRLIFFSINSSKKDIELGFLTFRYNFYWYGDPKDWTTSYDLFVVNEELFSIKCKFLVLNVYSGGYINQLDIKNSYRFIIYKSCWKDKLSVDAFADTFNYKEYNYEQSTKYLKSKIDIKNKILQYKINIENNNFNQFIYLNWVQLLFADYIPKNLGSKDLIENFILKDKKNKLEQKKNKFKIINNLKKNG